MRKRDKKALTPLGARRLLARCYEMHQKGHDVNEALLIAADCHWLTIYPPKDNSIEAKAGSTGLAESSAWLREQEEAKRRATRPPEAILRMVGKR